MRPKKDDLPPSAFDAVAEIRSVLERNATDRIYAPLFEKHEHGSTP